MILLVQPGFGEAGMAKDRATKASKIRLSVDERECLDRLVR